MNSTEVAIAWLESQKDWNFKGVAWGEQGRRYTAECTTTCSCGNLDHSIVCSGYGATLLAAIVSLRCDVEMRK
jgi:hypothetical protein